MGGQGRKFETSLGKTSLYQDPVSKKKKINKISREAAPAATNCPK
jgi:hypothetical protein